MKSNRIKKTILTLKNRDEAEATMNDLALAITNQRRLLAQRDAEVLAINKRYESGLSSYADAVSEKTDALRAWAEANPSEFPKGRKSLDLVAGVIGFRTGTPKLALLSRAWKWDRVLELLKSLAPDFVRTKEEIDKDAILADHANGGSTDAGLASLGVKVTQDENFYIEPKIADMAARQTAEGK